MSRVQKENGMDDQSRVAAVREVWLPGLRHHGGNFPGHAPTLDPVVPREIVLPLTPAERGCRARTLHGSGHGHQRSEIHRPQDVGSLEATGGKGIARYSPLGQYRYPNAFSF